MAEQSGSDEQQSKCSVGRVSVCLLCLSQLTSVCTFCDPFSLEMSSSAIATSTGCDRGGQRKEVDQ